MKNLILKISVILFTLVLVTSSCGSTKDRVTFSDQEKMAFKKQTGDTLKIESDKTEYEILIIEPGFNFWLQSIAKPEGYYSQSYMENRNKFM